MPWRAIRSRVRRTPATLNVPDLAGIIHTDQLFQSALAGRDPGQYLGAAAARCAPANLLCFEQDYIEATLGQVQRRGSARNATADDTDVAVLAVGERRARRRRVAGGRIIGAREGLAGHNEPGVFKIFKAPNAALRTPPASVLKSVRWTRKWLYVGLSPEFTTDPGLAKMCV